MARRRSHAVRSITLCGELVMKKEKIHMLLGILAYIIFNFGMFIFNYQNIDKVVGPCEGSMSIMHGTGCLVN